MLILLTIFLFIFIPIVMLIFRLARPQFSIQGFLAVLATIGGLVMVILARTDIPANIALLNWQPEILFSTSPSLLIDQTSWYLALALVSLSLCIVISSIAQLGQSSAARFQNTPATAALSGESQGNLDSAPASMMKTTVTPGSVANWQLWAAILLLSSISMVAVSAGNLLTVLLAWAVLDIIELFILLSQAQHAKMLERAVLIFSARLAGLVILLFATLVLWSQGDGLNFDAISPGVNIILLIAVGIRLGVLPFQPFARGLVMNRHLGSALRLIPAASSYILLARLSNNSVSGAITPYLLGLIALGGIFSGVKWLTARDDLEGRAYWLLGSASLILAAAILNLPSACLAWSIASLLSGGFIFSMSIRHRNLLPLVVLQAASLSTLPFSPTWQGASLYRFSAMAGVSLTLFSFFSLLFLFTQAFLLAGFVRHSLREIYPAVPEQPIQVERWAWFLYPLGLILIVITHLAFGYLLVPDLNNLALASWIIGPLTLIIAGFSLFFFWRYLQPISGIRLPLNPGFLDRLFSLEWFYGLLGKLFQLVSRIFTLFSTILEGDGGILWAIVLFALILVFLQR